MRDAAHIPVFIRPEFGVPAETLPPVLQQFRKFLVGPFGSCRRHRSLLGTSSTSICSMIVHAVIWLIGVVVVNTAHDGLQVVVAAALHIQAQEGRK